MKPYGLLASANRSRLKSAGEKDSKSAELSSNMPIQCPWCKKVFWKQYLPKHFSQKHANLTMSRPRPPLLSRVSQCSFTKEIMSRVSSRIWDEPRRWLSSVSTMTRTHMRCTSVRRTRQLCSIHFECGVVVRVSAECNALQYTATRLQLAQHLARQLNGRVEHSELQPCCSVLRRDALDSWTVVADV